MRFCPGLYALSYRWGNAGSGSLFLRNLINRVLLRCGKNYLTDVAPDVVLSTHGTPTGILSLYKKKYAPQLRIGVVVTDYTVHRWLVYPEVDVYFIAEQALEEQVAKALSTQETGPSVSRAFGIPVREMLLPFCVAVGRQEARREMCIRDSIYTFHFTVYHSAYGLHIGLPRSFGVAVGVADIVAGHYTFTAYFAILCH